LRVEPRVVRLDGDLRANARIACGSPDLDQPLFDLGYFELEQPHDELGRNPRQDQLRAFCRTVDLHHVSAHAIADAEHFLRDQLIARDHAFDAAGLDDRVAALDALDRPREQVVFAFEEVVQDLLALGIADLLQDDLLRGLSADAPELDRLERLLDDVAQLERGIAQSGIGDRDLMRRLLVLFVGHDGPTAK